MTKRRKKERKLLVILDDGIEKIMKIVDKEREKDKGREIKSEME